jgi:hypothetical protein
MCAGYERNPFSKKLVCDVTRPARSRERFHARSRAAKRAEADLNYGPSSPQQERESVMNEWLKPQIQESEAGMEVTSYLPAELDRA